MNQPRVQVVAPARIHFGMLSFGEPRGRQFGGIGVMVDEPAVRVEFAPAERFQVGGPLAERARDVADRWCRWRGRDELPSCRIEIRTYPEPHTGLGTGTQLALAIAAGLNRLVFPHAPAASAAELAAASGRGQRSAVGTYGFDGGGLILEPGKLPGETIAPLSGA